MRSNFQVVVDRGPPVRSGQKLAESLVKDAKEAVMSHLEMTSRLDDLPNDRRDPLLGARIPECQPTPVLGELSGQPSQHIPIAICLVLKAGYETTTNLIGNGVDLLIRNPDALHQLRDHPELIESAVREFLRVESSNQLGNRRAAKDTTLGGVAMQRGTYIHIGIGAANRDPAQFPNPERLDIARHPNRHLAFGTGIHACAGMSLAQRGGFVADGVKRTSQLDRVVSINDPERHFATVV